MVITFLGNLEAVELFSPSLSYVMEKAGTWHTPEYVNAKAM